MSVLGERRWPATLRVQDLIGRVVVDAAGQRLGRVVECIAEPRGEELRVVALLVGPGAWWARFGPTQVAGGRRVRWEEIATLSPRITLRPGTETEG
jgi:sporulation protein YlmC with PRC-barrel domain